MNPEPYLAIPISCEEEVVRALRRVNRKALTHTTTTAKELARVAAVAERTLKGISASFVGAVVLHTSGSTRGRVNAVRTRTTLVRAERSWVLVRVARVRRYPPSLLYLLPPDLLAASQATDWRFRAFELPVELVPVVARLVPAHHLTSLLTST